MKVKFWGCRGSIPVPDSRMIKYGGNTTCVEVRLSERILIIDAGTGIRKLGDDLIKRNIFDFDIFITHSHWDHIQGFPFFRPIYLPKTRIDIFGCTNSFRPLKDILGSQMSSEYFPMSFQDLKSEINFAESCSKLYQSHNFHIKTIQTNHPVFTSGLRIEEDGKSFVFITDNELGTTKPITPKEDFVNFCKDASYLVHDAQFTEDEYKTRKGWGHSTFEQAIKLARDSGAKNIGLSHHDPNTEDSELDQIASKFVAQQDKLKVHIIKEMDEIEVDG